MYGRTEVDIEVILIPEVPAAWVTPEGDKSGASVLGQAAFFGEVDCAFTAAVFRCMDGWTRVIIELDLRSKGLVAPVAAELLDMNSGAVLFQGYLVGKVQGATVAGYLTGMHGIGVGVQAGLVGK